MQEKIKGIVLNVRKYNDRNNIVTLYTRTRGRLVFISSDGTGRASNARRARLQPLSVISTEINYKPTSELQRLGSVTLESVWKEIYFHPAKRAISIFISEFLYRLLNATMEDEKLWDFVYESLVMLDGMDNKISDFHISFLISMLPFMGIQPDVSGYSGDKVFDFISGSFIPAADSHGPSLRGAAAKAVLWVNRLNFYNLRKLKTGVETRREILENLLVYYGCHYPGISTMKSLEVLREIF